MHDHDDDGDDGGGGGIMEQTGENRLKRRGGVGDLGHQT